MTFQITSLAGNLGATTASIYVLDPTGTVPLAPLPDSIPGMSPLRVTADVVDQESIQRGYTVTREPLQDIGDATTHIRRELHQMSLTLTFSAIPAPLVPGLIQGGALGNFGAVAPITGQTGGVFDFIRFDVQRLTNLVAIADRRQLVQVVTPRQSIARGLITNITSPWSPGDGDQLIVSLQVTEARIVSPLTGILVPDTASLASGNNGTVNGGQQATTPVVSEPVQSELTGLPPQIGGAGTPPVF